MILIKSKYIIPMSANFEIIEDGCIFIENGKIIAIGKYDELKNKYESDETIDFGNKVVMPGFINTHTHIPMTYFRGMADDIPLNDWLNNHIWPAEAKFVNPEFVKKASELACLEMIKSGVTCFADMYFFEDEVAKVAESFGMRAVIGEALLDFPTPNAKTFEEGLEITKQLIDKYKNNELIKVAVAPHSIYVAKKENLEKCAQLARENDAIIHIHLSETKEEAENALRDFKLTPVEYLDSFGFLNEKTLAAHAIWLDRSEINLLADKKVKVSHNPTSNLKLGSGVSPVKEMLDKKITIGLGTDGAASNNTLEMISEIKLTAMLHKGICLDPTCVNTKEVLKMATINGAECLGLGKITGSLEVGKSTDLIAVDLDAPNMLPLHNIYSQLVYALQTENIKDVMVNGKILIRGKKLINIDEEKILSEAKSFLSLRA